MGGGFLSQNVLKNECLATGWMSSNHLAMDQGQNGRGGAGAGPAVGNSVTIGSGVSQG